MLITFQNTVLTAQKVLMVEESQSLTQRIPHKHVRQTNKSYFVFAVNLHIITKHSSVKNKSNYASLMFMLPKLYLPLLEHVIIYVLKYTQLSQ